MKLGLHGYRDRKQKNTMVLVIKTSVKCNKLLVVYISVDEALAIPTADGLLPSTSTPSTIPFLLFTSLKALSSLFALTTLHSSALDLINLLLFTCYLLPLFLYSILKIRYQNLSSLLSQKSGNFLISLFIVSHILFWLPIIV